MKQNNTAEKYRLLNEKLSIVIHFYLVAEICQRVEGYPQIAHQRR